MFTNVSEVLGVSATGVSVVGAEATSAFLSIVSERTVIQCMDVHAFYTQTLNLRSKSIAEDFVEIILLLRSKSIAEDFVEIILLIILSEQIFQFCILTIILNFTHKKWLWGISVIDITAFFLFYEFLTNLTPLTSGRYVKFDKLIKQKKAVNLLLGYPRFIFLRR